VKSFAPAAKDVFRLVESDTGRPISHVRARFASDTVQDDAERVLRTLSTLERRVDSSHNGARYVMRILPYRTIDNVIAGVVLTFTDITKITAAEARIHALTRDVNDQIDNLQAVFDLVPAGVLIAEDGQTGTVRGNRYVSELLGEESVTSLHLLEGDAELRPEDQPLMKAIRLGRAVPSYEGVLVRADGRRVAVMISAAPLMSADGSVRGGIGVIIDISERKRGEAQQQLLLHELQHRVKNIITTVGALANRMLKGSMSVEDFGSAFSGRLSAMAKTHELLTANNWQGAGLRPLIDATVRSYSSRDGRNIAVSGPDLVLTPAAASTLGLVLYELATNAMKYGALKERGGRVAISWRVTKLNGSQDVSLEWIESDGPTINGTFQEGFGTGFIRRSVEYELNGKVDIELQSSGLHCRILFPSARNLLNGPTGLGGQKDAPSD
jgi:two-component system CheB/CheR fusion protein